jgi:ATP-binding cassette subfamily F protein 3
MVAAEQRKPLQKEAEKLEKQIAGWQAEKALLDTRVGDPALYSNPDRGLLDQLLKRQTELMKLIETAEASWLQTQEALEAL